MRYQWETLGKLLADGLEDMLWEDFREIEVDQDKVPMAPDWEHYFGLERLGGYRVIAARSEGQLVGHNAFFLNKHTRHKNTTFAINDMVYLAPDYRKGWAGVSIIRESERLLKEAGVVKIQYSVKEDVKIGSNGHGTVGDLLGSLGYQFIERVYAKVI